MAELSPSNNVISSSPSESIREYLTDTLEDSQRLRSLIKDNIAFKNTQDLSMKDLINGIWDGGIKTIEKFRDIMITMEASSAVWQIEKFLAVERARSRTSVNTDGPSRRSRQSYVYGVRD